MEIETRSFQTQINRRDCKSGRHHDAPGLRPAPPALRLEPSPPPWSCDGWRRKVEEPAGRRRQSAGIGGGGRFSPHTHTDSSACARMHRASRGAGLPESPLRVAAGAPFRSPSPPSRLAGSDDSDRRLQQGVPLLRIRRLPSQRRLQRRLQRSAAAFNAAFNGRRPCRRDCSGIGTCGPRPP
jgi:hypothetical protein